MTDVYSGDRDGNGEGLRSLGAVPMPAIERITAVAVVPIDAATGRVLGVRLNRGLDIPGGHRQRDDASPESTGRRECLEEACIELGEMRLIDVVESEYYGSAPEQLTYMLIYGAVIARMLPFAATDESHSRELLDPTDFLARYVAGDHGMMARWIAAAVEGSPARMQR